MNLQRDFSSTERQRGFMSLLESFKKNRFPNSNLLVCRDSEVCTFVARFFAKKILATENLDVCMDFMSVSPTGAMAQISVDQIRELCARIYLSPKVCARKFAAIFNVERMNNAAANAFLKTLEEPPDDAIIFLTTEKLHANLPTISGRCSITRLEADYETCENQRLKDWLSNYSAWLTTLFAPACERKTVAVMQMYLLLTQLEALANHLIESAAETDDSLNETTVKKEIHRMLFLKIEDATAEFFRRNLEVTRFFPRIIPQLERKAQLFAINVNFMACIEAFFIEIFEMTANLTGQSPAVAG